MGVFNYGPGATTEQNVAATNAMSQPHMGFGSRRNNVFNWTMQSPQPAPVMQAPQQQRDPMGEATRMANIARQEAYRANRGRAQPANDMGLGFDLAGLAGLFPDLFGGMAQDTSQSSPRTTSTQPRLYADQQNSGMLTPQTRAIQAAIQAATQQQQPQQQNPMGISPQLYDPKPMAAPSLNINSGIGVNPVVANPAANAAAMRNFSATLPSVPGMSFGPPSSGAVAEQFGDNIRAGANQNATDYSRQASYGNAQQQLAQERARAQSGLGWGNILLGDYSQQLGRQGSTNNALMGILASLM